MLAVFDGRLKGLGEVFGHQKGKVGVVGLIFLGLVGMAVDHRQAIFVILCGHLSRRIGTEGTHLIVEGGGIIHQLGLVEVLI